MDKSCLVHALHDPIRANVRPCVYRFRRARAQAHHAGLMTGGAALTLRIMDGPWSVLHGRTCTETRRVLNRSGLLAPPKERKKVLTETCAACRARPDARPRASRLTTYARAARGNRRAARLSMRAVFGGAIFAAQRLWRAAGAGLDKDGRAEHTYEASIAAQHAQPSLATPYPGLPLLLRWQQPA